MTTAPLNLQSTVKDDITRAIVDATGGVNSPFSDWTYYTHCDLPGYGPYDCSVGNDAGTDLNSDPGVNPIYYGYDNLFYTQPWVMDYKGGQSGFRVLGDNINSAILNRDTKKATFWLMFFGPASSSLSDIEIVTRSLLLSISHTKHPLNAPF